MSAPPAEAGSRRPTLSADRWYLLTLRQQVTRKSDTAKAEVWATIGYRMRLAGPLLFTLLAFPQVPVQAMVTLFGGGWRAAELLALGITVIGVVAVRSAPVAGDADVHDRQLDIILAAPAFAMSLWLVLGRPVSVAIGSAVSNRTVVAALCFAAGTAFLLCGTRLTARWRWAFLLAVLGMPAFADHGAASLIASWLGILTAAALVAWTVWNDRNWRPHQRGPGGGLRPRRPPGRGQRLPAALPAIVAITLMAVAIGAVGLTAEPQLPTSLVAGTSHDR